MPTILLNPGSMTVPEGIIYCFRSRKDRTKTLRDYEVIFQYKVLAECPIDITHALIALNEHNIEYTLLKCPPGNYENCHMYFETSYTIDHIRKVWYDMNMDLHYMIESLDFADDYTGKRYFEKYINDPKKHSNYDSDDDE